MLLEDGKVVVHLVHRWPDNAIKVAAGKAITLNAWHHVVVTCDGSRRAAGVKVYVDGKPEPLVTFRIHQEFGSWVERIGTGPDAVAGLRALFDAAPAEVRGAFDIRGDGEYDFSLDLALIRGQRLRERTT